MCWDDKTSMPIWSPPIMKGKMETVEYFFWVIKTIICCNIYFSKVIAYFVLSYSFVIDPYGVLAMLGFLVFLFYIIYNYLNATGNSGRHFVKRSNSPKSTDSGAELLNSHSALIIDIHKSFIKSIEHFDNIDQWLLPIRSICLSKKIFILQSINQFYMNERCFV